MKWAKEMDNEQYENWVPWLEAKYLAWFGENKSSYVAKSTSQSMPFLKTVEDLETHHLPAAHICNRCGHLKQDFFLAFG
jgi:hypothetical protein